MHNINLEFVDGDYDVEHLRGSPHKHQEQTQTQPNSDHGRKITEVTIVVYLEVISADITVYSGQPCDSVYGLWK